jgi:hypothetical protein
VSDEFTELQNFFADDGSGDGQPTTAARLLADVREWRSANPGWEEWDLDVRLSRFCLWLGERYASTPEARRHVTEDRERMRRDLLWNEAPRDGGNRPGPGQSYRRAAPFRRSNSHAVKQGGCRW